MAKKERIEITVSGVVQGIGFRPFVYRVATRHGLAGDVCNTGEGVTITVEGDAGQVAAFLRDFDEEMPALARIDGRSDRRMAPSTGAAAEADCERRETGGSAHESADRTDRRCAFVIAPSHDTTARKALVPPDLATCDACLAEMLDPADRRYLHPFINCTDCGPRYTILNDLPYDRPMTSMCSFEMCADCAKEYNDPADRRFHAQPVCCHRCGPSLELLDPAGRPVKSNLTGPARQTDTIGTVREALKSGRIVAIRGIGGFHLAVDATNREAVAELRRRKRRSNKPFAVMCREMSVVRRLCEVGEEAEKLLTSPARPIVLMKSKQPVSSCPGASERRQVAGAVAPDNPLLGVMLPYTGLHVLMMDEELDVLVMTSANFSDEPILAHTQAAVDGLGEVVDLFLTHDREIRHRADDSVARIVAGEPLIMRRSRGYVLGNIHVPDGYPPILACGAEMKNTVCMNRSGDAFPSQHLGDTDSREGLVFYEETVDHLERLLGIEPQVIAHDMHPDYLSTRYALDRPEQTKIAVQHHEAHVAAIQAEHDILDRPVIGIALDGTGYGRDGTIWGGEVFAGKPTEYRRAAKLRPVVLPGGEQAVRQPWRTALSYLYYAFGDAALDLPLPILDDPGGREGPQRNARQGEKTRVSSEDAGSTRRTAELTFDVVKRRLGSPMTSSCGRLFDAVSALTGLCVEMTFEAEPAIALEMQLPEPIRQTGRPALNGYPFELVEEDGMLVIETSDLIRALVSDIVKGSSPASVSLRFHATVVRMFVDVACRLADEYDIADVALGGGVFNNAFILEGMITALEERGLTPRRPLAMPPGDGSISLGQLVIAGETLRERGD